MGNTEMISKWIEIDLIDADREEGVSRCGDDIHQNTHTIWRSNPDCKVTEINFW